MTIVARGVALVRPRAGPSRNVSAAQFLFDPFDDIQGIFSVLGFIQIDLD